MLLLLSLNHLLVGGDVLMDTLEHLQELDATAHRPLALVDIALPIPHLQVMHHSATPA